MIMKHARNYTVYRKSTGHLNHSPDRYDIEMIDGVPCCGKCTYPLAGVYRITVKEGWRDFLLTEFRQWRVQSFTLEGKDSILTGDPNVIDVAIETFIDAKHLIQVEKLTART